MVLFHLQANPPVPFSVAGRTVWLTSREVTSEWLAEHGLGPDWCASWVASGLLTPAYVPETPVVPAPEPEPIGLPDAVIPSEAKPLKPGKAKKADEPPKPPVEPPAEVEPELTLAQLLEALPKNLMQSTPEELKAVLVANGMEPAGLPSAKVDLIREVSALREVQ